MKIYLYLVYSIILFIITNIYTEIATSAANIENNQINEFEIINSIEVELNSLSLQNKFKVYYINSLIDVNKNIYKNLLLFYNLKNKNVWWWIYTSKNEKFNFQNETYKFVKQLWYIENYGVMRLWNYNGVLCIQPSIFKMNNINEIVNILKTTNDNYIYNSQLKFKDVEICKSVGDDFFRKKNDYACGPPPFDIVTVFMNNNILYISIKSSILKNTYATVGLDRNYKIVYSERHTD